MHRAGVRIAISHTLIDPVTPDQRISVLLTLADEPGGLEAALRPFSNHGVNLTHIESRPARGGTFDIFVDFDGSPGEAPSRALLDELDRSVISLLVLDRRSVPWFPRHISELDEIANRILTAGADLEADHPVSMTRSTGHDGARSMR